MRVLIACEFSGIVRDAFAARGHDAWSCDLLPTEQPGNHIQGDVLDVLGKLACPFCGFECETGKYFLGDSTLYLKSSALCPQCSAAKLAGWDMLLFFYPCTNMCVSGARWFHLKRAEQARDVANFKRLAECGIPKTAGENPIGVLSTLYRKPDQIIQPWQFGHGETKATCLWLKGLPLLVPTDIVSGRHPRVHHASPGPDRWKERSRTLPGIAKAMAEQWG